MTIGDYLANLLLIALVVGQMRGKPLTVFGLLWPVGLVILLGVKHIHAMPRGGNDLQFVALGAVLGAMLGVLCGLFTRIYRKDTRLIGKATGIAALFWILGTGCRTAFGLYATHGGGPAIAHFSVAHHLTGQDVWVAALLFMALTEVIGRTTILGARTWTLQRTAVEVSNG